MQKQILTILMLAIVASIGLTVASSNVVFAQAPPTGSNPNTNNPSGWGDVTSGAATQDGRQFGQHASNPPDLNPQQPGREGLGNILDPRQPNPTNPQKHPTNVGEFVCQIDPNAAGCNRLP